MNTIETFEALVKDIEDRRGLKHEWAAIDPDVKDEIRLAWLAIIDQHKDEASLNVSLTRIADALEKLPKSETDPCVRDAMFECGSEVLELRKQLAIVEEQRGRLTDAISRNIGEFQALQRDYEKLKKGHTHATDLHSWTCDGGPVGALSCGCVDVVHKLQARIEELEAPISMRLPCPICGKLHIDEGKYADGHRTHACQHCGATWQPAVQKTIGIQFLPGFKNEAPHGCFWVGCTRTFANDTNRRKHMVDDHGDERFR